MNKNVIFQVIFPSFPQFYSNFNEGNFWKHILLSMANISNIQENNDLLPVNTFSSFDWYAFCYLYPNNSQFVNGRLLISKTM